MKSSRIVSSLGLENYDEKISPGHAQLLQQRLPKLSIRFIAISATLWSLVVQDSYRSANVASLSQFLDVMTWRIHDKITSEEFSVLCVEWMHAQASVLSQSRSPPPKGSSQTSHFPLKHRSLLSLNVFRAILLEKKFTEADLDLFVGLMLNEVNSKLLHATITYGSHSKNAFNHSMINCVTQQWLALTEELFFAIDFSGIITFRLLLLFICLSSNIRF